MSSVDYGWLRNFVDSYGLVATMLAYLTLVLWAFRPGSRQHHQDAATMILAEEDGSPRPEQGARNNG